MMIYVDTRLCNPVKSEWVERCPSSIFFIHATPLLLCKTTLLWWMTGLVFAVKLSVAPASTGDSEPPAHRSDSHWEGRGLALPPLDDLWHTQFVLGGLEETVVGIFPSQAAGCNWCDRDVSTNLLLSDGLSVSPSSTQLRDLPYQP